MPSQEDQDAEDEEEELPVEKAKKGPGEDTRPPSDLARHDVIKVGLCWVQVQSLPGMCWAGGVIRACVLYLQGLLATNLLPRLRYVLEVTVPAPSVVLDILAVLIRLARHSLESATRVRMMGWAR